MFIKGKLFQSDPQLIQIGTSSSKQGKYCCFAPAENLVNDFINARPVSFFMLYVLFILKKKVL